MELNHSFKRNGLWDLTTYTKETVYGIKPLLQMERLWD